jgi:hypothetical protein
MPTFEVTHTAAYNNGATEVHVARLDAESVHAAVAEAGRQFVDQELEAGRVGPVGMNVEANQRS